LDRYRFVDNFGVAYGVADVVGEGTDGEGEFVGCVGIADEAEDEVAGADVVCKVAEEGLAKGVVAQVLNGAAAISVGVSLSNLRFGHVGEALEEKGSDGLLPGEVNELLVGLDRVREARLREDE